MKSVGCFSLQKRDDSMGDDGYERGDNNVLKH